MLPCRPAWVALLLLSLLAPSTAGAFSTREEPLSLAYGRDATPVVLAVGALTLSGELRGGFVASDVTGLTLLDVPQLTVTEREASAAPRNSTFRGVDVVVHGGSVLWTFGARDRLDASISAPYAIGLALPQVPLAAGEDGGPGVLAVAPALRGDLSWSGDEGRLLVMDAEVTLLDASGSPLPGWERRAVNPGAQPTSPPDSFDTLFQLSGAFEGTADARIQGGALGSGEALSLSVSPAEESRFDDTLDVLSGARSLFGEDGADAFGPSSPVRQLGPLSDVLNGALLVLGDASGGKDEAPEPLEARLGDEPFEVGPMALLRGDPMSLAWDEGQMRVQGTPVVALSGGGFAVETPATLAGLLPIVSLVLWALAAGAIVLYFVKRPPEAEGRWVLRLGSLAIHLLVLVVVFWLWDASFAETFGTSVLTLLRQGVAFDDPARLGLLFAVETAPWGLAALLFALPVRILLGVGLRYLGKGKSFKGIAKAGGLVALGILGPLYALWLLNTVVAKVFSFLPDMFA